MTTHRCLQVAAQLGTIMLVACTGSSGRTTGSSPTEATNSIAGTGAGTGVDTTVGTGTTLFRRGEGSGPGEFVLLDPVVGLTSLSSYRSTLTLTFDGTTSGKAQQWTSTSAMVRQADPEAAVATIDVTGDTERPALSFAAESAGTAYWLDGDGKCTADAVDPDSSLVSALEPAMALDGVVGAASIGSKQIAGVAADGFQFDERAIGMDGLAKSDGELWVAHDGGYVLDYHVTTTGSEDMFGPDANGTLTEQYTLTEIGQPVSLDLPDDCPAAFLVGPVPDDATNVITGPGLLTFDTTSSAASIVTFYTDAAAGLGWSAGVAPQVGADGGVAEFTADDRHLVLSIATTDTGTSVTLSEVNVSAPTGEVQSPSGGATRGEATIAMTGDHPLSATWPFVPEMSFFSGTWTLTFTDPANPLPAGSFLTLSLTPGGENVSFSDGQITIIAGPDVCAFAVDQQNAAVARGTVTCHGVTGLGGVGGTVDVAVTVDVGG